MTKVQIIEHDGKPAYAVVPIAMWERMRENIEDAQDIQAFDRAKANDDGVTYPAVVAYAIADGAHPIKAWREHKGMTLQALAAAAALSKPYVSQIEGGKRTGTAATLKKLARALGVPAVALLP